MSKTLYDKIWENHLVHEQNDGTTLIYVDRHLVHEVTSPQAFEGLRLQKRKVRRAKLYYLRDRKGKSARIAEKIKKKIGVDVSVKPEEPKAVSVEPVKEVSKIEELKKEDKKVEAEAEKQTSEKK